MKKILIIIFSFLLLIVALSYTLVFTSVGNNLLKPIVEAKINERSPVPVKLSEFMLRMDRFRFLLKFDEQNTILAQGTYSLFSQNFDIDYNVSFTKLSNLRNFASRKLSGNLFTDGKVTGNLDLFRVKGKSDLAMSDTSYAIVMKDMELNKADIKLSDINISALLSMLGEKVYSSGKIDLDVQLNDLNPKNMQGNVVLDVKEANLNAKVLKKEFGVSISKTAISSKLRAKLDGESISYNFKLDSELAKLLSNGNINPSNIKTDISYEIKIKELSILKPITGLALRGPLATSGTVKGDKKELLVKGESKLASSKISYAFSLQDLEPKTAKVSIKNAELSKLLYFAGEPSYARGKFSLNVDMSSLSPFNGKIKLDVSKGIMHSKVIKKTFDINLPQTSFDISSDVTIKDDELAAKTFINSNLAKLSMKKTNFNIKTTSLKADYQIYIPSLEKLEPILERKLFGKVTVNGEIEKDKKLAITAHSKIFNGKLNAKIANEKINADFTNLHAVKVLKMLGYPQVMDAPLNGNFVYNIKTKKGKLDSSFDSAILTRSKMTDLIGSLTNLNLTKERFSKGTLVANIDKDIIKSDLKMQSKNVTLNSKKFIINSKKQLIDSRFFIKVKKYSGDVLVTKSINSPKVEVDFGSLLESPETKEIIEKEINRFLEKLF